MIVALFQQVIKQEEVIREAKRELESHTSRLKVSIATAETQLAEAWEKIAEVMKETGEYEVVIPGTVSDYRIGYSTPRESVKVADPAAVPDEFVKIERKPNLIAIREHLSNLANHNEPLPNWARFERGEPKLEWKAKKKETA